MSLLTISAREKRTLRLAAMVVIPALAYVYLGKPYLASLSDMKDQVVAERTALAREQALLVQYAKNPESQRDANQAVQQAAPMLFDGRDDIIASSDLAAYVTRLAEHYRVNLQQAATRPTILSPAGVRLLRVEIRGESDLQGILAFLNALEAGDKLVRFDKLDITHSPGRRTDEDGYETLSIAATVTGFAINESATNAKAPSTDTSKRSATTVSQRGTQ